MNELNKYAFYDEGRSLRERFIREFTPMVDGRGNSLTIKGIFNGLMRAADKSTTQEAHLFMHWFMNLDTGDFINVRGFGPEKVIVCRDIQEKIRDNGDLLDKLLANCKTVR